MRLRAVSIVLLNAVLGITLISCGVASGGNSTRPAAPSIVTQPANQTVVVGKTATFTVVASGSEPLTYQWQRGTTAIMGATTATYTTPLTALADSGSSFRVVVTNSVGSAISNAATLTVNSAATTDVVTYHNDIARTGQNLNETVLTLANVNSTNFGKIGFYPMDGKVDAQPLYLSNVNIPGQGSHNVLYVATEHDSVYAFDADNGTQLWKVCVLGAGENTSDPRNCSEVVPEIGITATPVVDRSRGPNGAIYVVAMSKNGKSRVRMLFYRSRALLCL